MKKIYTILFILCFISIPQALQAQCSPLVPSNVQVIPFGANDSSINYPGRTHHICFNSYYYYFNNNPDTIYLEGSTFLTIGWCQNLTIYMSNNAHLKIDTTTSGIYHIKKLVYDTAYTVFVDTSYATIDSAIACPGMAFNYSNFSGSISPCYLLGEEQADEPDIKIYPTVTTGEIRIETLVDDYEIGIYDMMGRRIMLSGSKNLMDIGNASPGMYLVTILSNNKIIRTEKIFLVR